MYSNERTAQLVVALLKKHRIKKVIASPGNTNYGIVGSCQQDPFFEMYSSVDERSAAYMACGMASASGEPVVLSCTGATASREYLAGLTEAYYRKIPVVAITSFNGTYNVGQLVPQNIDRRVSQDDVKVFSVDLPLVKDGEDERYLVRKVNEALLACKRHGGGPVHINVTCDYSNGGFATPSLPECRIYCRHMHSDKLPLMDRFGKIAVFIGAHAPFSDAELSAIERFAVSRDVVVLRDHTSNYRGAKGTLSALVAENSGRWSSAAKMLAPDLVIDIGEVSGDYVTTDFLESSHAPCWRVSEDGELRDRFHTLTDVFEMGIAEFFCRYALDEVGPAGYWWAWESRRASLLADLAHLPFTNRWIARQLAPMLPEGCVLHLAILNSLRSWDYWELDPSVNVYCNTGGFGIDGAISTAMGAALADLKRMNYLVCGDLAFFYDMNALGNRHLPANLRVLLVNNGVGVEFHMPYSPAAVMGEDVNAYVAAAGHYRNRSAEIPDAPSPARAWCEGLGLKYLRADSKEAFLSVADEFTLGECDRPVVFECFVNSADEKVAVEMLASLDVDATRKRKLAKIAKAMLPKAVQLAIRQALK